MKQLKAPAFLTASIFTLTLALTSLCTFAPFSAFGTLALALAFCASVAAVSVQLGTGFFVGLRFYFSGNISGIVGARGPSLCLLQLLPSTSVFRGYEVFRGSSRSKPRSDHLSDLRVVEDVLNIPPI